MKRPYALYPLLALLLAIPWAVAGEINRVTVAGFSRLAPGAELPAQWRTLTVPRIKRHTRYSLQKIDDVTVLQAEADASMSSLATDLDVDPASTPWLHWRWRIAMVNPRSGLERKDQDDFVARIYVFFDFDIGRLPLFQRVKIRVARAIYGDQLPLAALCYVWSNKDAVGTTAWNAYTDRVRMIVASSGNEQAGKWVEVRRNVVDDYRAAFGEPVPRITGVAIATDTDDTQARSTAWYADMFFSDSPLTQPREDPNQ